MKPKNYLSVSFLLCIVCFLLVYPLIFALLPSLAGEEADPDKQAVETTESGENINEASLVRPERSDGLKVGMYQRGEASYYGAKFHGRLTANGEHFDMNTMTAAHKTLPFGTMLSVTNLNNNKKITVRINDRGPYISGRIIDISKKGAELLKMLGTGVAPVEIVIQALPEPYKKLRILRSTENHIEAANGLPLSNNADKNSAIRANEANEANEAKESPEITVEKQQLPTDKRFAIQIVSYAQVEHAHRQLDRLEGVGLAIHLERFGKYYRLILPGLKAEEIAAYRKRLTELGFPNVLLRQE